MAYGQSGAGPRVGPLERLLLASASRDESAFAELYDALCAQVYGVVRSIVADPEQAADVTCAAFVEVWQRAREFDPALASAHSWTLSITHLVAVRHRRGVRARGTRPAGPPARRRASLEPGRDALQLAYLGGCTEAEIAALMSTSIDTTRGLITDSLVLLSREN